jgi:hypothetical protein
MGGIMSIKERLQEERQQERTERRREHLNEMNHDCTEELLHDNFVMEYGNEFDKNPDAEAEAVYKENINPEGVYTAINHAVADVVDIFRERAWALERAAEDALTVSAFVVTVTGDAPVQVSEIVSADIHTELLTQYVSTGYAATPVTIRKRSLDSMIAKREAAAAGK